MGTIYLHDDDRLKILMDFSEHGTLWNSVHRQQNFVTNIFCSSFKYLCKILQMNSLVHF